MKIAIIAIIWVNLFICFCSGLGSSFTAWVSDAIVLNSVFEPVENTTALPEPDVTLVPARIRLLKPTKPSLSFMIGSETFLMGLDSPVRVEVSTFI
jgi:hypothetical protein